MGMTDTKGVMNAGTTGKAMESPGGVMGIVGLTGSMTVATMVGTMGVIDGPLLRQ
jgi:hypothetical protein